jgi:hypothetical protein
MTISLKKIFFKKKYEEDQKEQEKWEKEEILRKKQLEESKKRTEEENKTRSIFCEKSIDKIPEGENPRDFVRIGYSVSMHCPNYPNEAYGDTTAQFGPYFLTLRNSFHFGSKGRYHDGKKFIRISEIPVSLEKLIGDAKAHRQHVSGDLCCSKAEASLETDISAGDGGLLIPQAIERIDYIKKGKVLRMDLDSLSDLYSRIGKEYISKELKKHYENSILNKGKNSSIRLINNTNFRSEADQKKIFYEETTKIQGCNSEIEKLAKERDSELWALEREIKGSYSPGVTPSLLTKDSMEKLRKEVIGKYDPKIREFYGKIKDEEWEKKTDSIEKLERKYENDKKSINKNEYKTLYRAARLARREK